MIVVYEILHGKRKTTILSKRFDSRNQPGAITKGAANICQNDFRCLLFKLDVFDA